VRGDECGVRGILTWLQVQHTREGPAQRLIKLLLKV
jgi:hypothetical protein